MIRIGSLVKVTSKKSKNREMVGRLVGECKRNYGYCSLYRIMLSNGKRISLSRDSFEEVV